MNEHQNQAAGPPRWSQAQRLALIGELAPTHLDADSLDAFFQPAELPVAAREMGLRPAQVLAEGGLPIDKVAEEDRPKVFGLIGVARRRGVSAAEIRFTDLDEPAVLHLIDMTDKWGVTIVVRGGTADLGRAGADRALIPRPRRLVQHRDSSATFTWIDEHTTTVLGWTHDDLVGQTAAEFVHPDDAGRAIDNWLTMLAGYPTEPIRLRYRNKWGDYRWFEVHNTNRLADRGVVECELIDVDDEMQAIARVRDSELQFSTLAESLPVGVLQFDSAGDLVFSNAWMHELTGLDPVHMSALDWIPADERDGLCHRVRRVLASEVGADEEFELSVIAANGRTRACRLRLRSVATTKSPGAIASVVDMTESVGLQESLRTQALTDPLTQLPNRRALHEWISTLRAGRSIALFFVDLDDFKIVNDGMGHDIGDEVLATIAELIHQSVRPRDFVARLGGDEFVVGCVDVAGPGEAAEIATRILRSFDRPIVSSARPFALGCSIGIALAQSGAVRPQDLISNADLAMYEAKRSGGNRFAFYKPEQRLGVERRLRHEAEMRESLDEGRFELYLQPIVDLMSNTTAGFESLVRWNHPELGLLSPAEFIGIAENSGLMHALGAWIVDEACRLSKALVRAELPSRMSVNVSPVQLAASTFASVVHEAVARHEIKPHKLVLEVTETVFLETNEDLLMSLNSLVESGIRVAIDDFGTGYSSLNHLRLLPSQIVKIDRAYTAEMEIDYGTAAIVQSMVELCGRLGQEIVVEGIETPRQAELVRDFGVRYGQGYLFGRPAPVSTILPSEVSERTPNSG